MYLRVFINYVGQSEVCYCHIGEGFKLHVHVHRLLVAFLIVHSDRHISVKEYSNHFHRTCNRYSDHFTLHGISLLTF